MSDLSSPALSLVPVEAAAAPWRWPTLPFAGYAAPIDRPGVACEVEGLTRTPIRAELLVLDFEAGRARVRVASTKAEMTLRFAQFRRITLTKALVVQTPAAGDPRAALLAHRPVSD